MGSDFRDSMGHGIFLKTRNSNAMRLRKIWAGV